MSGRTHRAPGPPLPALGLMWAQAHDRVIGAQGSMPWHLPEDLAHFKRTTLGSPVVMGRRTWESFPARFRPLPGRTNVVITRDASVAEQGAVQAGDLPEALAAAAGAGGEAGVDDAAGAGAGAGADENAPVGGADRSPTVWVIGGSGVYREAIDHADRLEVTEIDLAVEGDTTAPEIPEAFTLTAADPTQGWHESSTGLRYRFLTYTR